VSVPRRKKANPWRALRTKVFEVRHIRIFAAMALALAVLLFASAPALAAGPPEAPIMQCHPLVIPAGRPFVCGTLNPHSKEKLTNAYLTFNAGSTCTGAHRVQVEGLGPNTRSASWLSTRPVKPPATR
jgi:hypothetical protein